MPPEHSRTSRDATFLVDSDQVPALRVSIGNTCPQTPSKAESAIKPPRNPYDRSRVATVFDPDAHLPRINRGMIYLGACLIAGIRLARERQVNVRVIPTGQAIEESVELAHEIYNKVFRKVARDLEDK